MNGDKPKPGDWVCFNPNCQQYLRKTDVDYYEDHEGYPLIYCKWCNDTDVGSWGEYRAKGKENK